MMIEDTACLSRKNMTVNFKEVKLSRPAFAQRVFSSFSEIKAVGPKYKDVQKDDVRMAPMRLSAVPQFTAYLHTGISHSCSCTTTHNMKPMGPYSSKLFLASFFASDNLCSDMRWHHINKHLAKVTYVSRLSTFAEYRYLHFMECSGSAGPIT